MFRIQSPLRLPTAASRLQLVLADVNSTTSHTGTRDNQYEEADESQRSQRRDRRELNRRYKRDPYSE